MSSNTPSTHVHPRRYDGGLFDEKYLLTPNRDVAESILWPIPVLVQSSDNSLSVNGVELAPGDVCELIATDREEFLLVVSCIHDSATIHRSRVNAPTILAYSTNTESLLTLAPGACSTVEPSLVLPSDQREYATAFEQAGIGRLLTYDGEAYAVHHGVVPPLDDDPVASISWVQESPAAVGRGRSRPEAYYPYARPPSPMSPSYPSGVHHPSCERAYSRGDLVDELLVGDAETTLSRIPDDTFHCWVTSPPYPQAQRDYDVDGQLGVETTPGVYLQNLLSVILQAMRVSREDGTGWLIIDDAITDGEYVGVPDRLVAQLREEGFRVIHNGPWVKSGGKPDPAPRRFAHTHERVIGIAQSGSYVFDRRAVGDDTDVFELPTNAQSDFDSPAGDTVHDAMFSVELASHLIEAATPKFVCPECHAPFTPQYEVTDILDLEENRHKERVLKAFHRTPEMTRDHARACRSLGLSDVGQAARTQSGAGNNAERVQRLVDEVRASSFPNSYMREFSYARKHLTGYTQSCDCSTDAIDAGDVDAAEAAAALICDPFVGSGTTCAAAVRHGRSYTGIDLNPDYVDLARTRLGDGISASLTQFGD